MGVSFSTNETVNIPEHQEGDLIIIHGWKSADKTPPAVGGTFQELISGGSGTNANCVGWLVAEDSGTLSGVWSNAERLSCVVLRGRTIDQPAVDIGGGAIDSLYWGSPRYAEPRWALLFGENSSKYRTVACSIAPVGYRNLGFVNGQGSTIHISKKPVLIVDAFASLTPSGGIPQYRTATIPLIPTNT